MTANGSLASAAGASPIGASATVTLSDGSGVVFVPASAPLIGLNYYDGRFLRADDLNLERQGQRAYADYSNQAGGPGLVYGFDLTWQGTQLALSPGLAVDQKGRLLYLSDTVQADIGSLVKASQAASSPSAQAAAAPAGFAPCGPAAAIAGATAPVVGGTGLYLVCLSYAQALCGQSEVFGRVCDDACVTATDRPYVVDGVTLSVLPLMLRHPLPTLAGVTRPEVHLRSQVASAYFADEQDQGGSSLSASGLRTGVWCAGAVPAAAGNAVPIGVLGWDGKTATFLDEWIVRRERTETPPRAYWAGRMELRPWPVFLAQVLQFQCQLSDPGQPGPAPAPAQGSQALLDRGFVELPSAAYLPVDVASGTALRTQIQGLLGAGVDLRFCAVRRDQIAHELERAQHMDRISLISGLSSRAGRELVDILVPDGVLETDAASTDLGFEVDVAFGPDASSDTPAAQPSADLRRLLLRGVGRVNLEGGLSVAAAAAGSAADLRELAALLARLRSPGTDVGQALGGLRQVASHSGPPTAGLLQEAGNRVIKAGIAQRTAGSQDPVVKVPDPGAPVAAISVSGWVAQDPFTMADGAYAAFHLGIGLIVLSNKVTTAVTFTADGRLRRRSRQPWGTGDQVAATVTGFAQASVTSGDHTDNSSGQFSQALVLRRGDQGGSSVLGLSGSRPTWMAGVGWQGNPVQARGGLMLIADGQDPGAAGAVPDAFTLALGGISHRSAPAPSSYDVIVAVDATQDAAVSQPGDPHRAAAIAALDILSALHPGDVTYVEDGYAELFPGATALASHVRPVTDWVLFRRRRREDCEGTVEPAQAAPNTVAAWLARAETVDQAIFWTTGLFDSGGGKIPWQAVSGAPLEFAAGAATLITAPSAWRDQYQQADGGQAVHSAGYAPTPGGSDVPVGVGRTRTLLDATAPAATLDPDGRVDLVGEPPAGRLLAGTDGSIFLITYQPDPVDVITVDAMDNEALAAAIRAPGPDTVAPADAAGTLLASVAVAGGLTPSVAGLASELDARKTEVAGQHENQTVFVSAVVWLASSLSGQRETQSRDHASRVLSALDLSAGDPLPVGFQPGGGAPVRIYLLFQPQQAQPG